MGNAGNKPSNIFEDLERFGGALSRGLFRGIAGRRRTCAVRMTQSRLSFRRASIRNTRSCTGRWRRAVSNPGDRSSKINPDFLRLEVAYPTPSRPARSSSIRRALSLLHRAGRYGDALRRRRGQTRVRVDRRGHHNSKQEWPNWYPPAEMIERRPDIKPQLVDLQSGKGVPGGPRNPIGARGLYLWQGNVDTLYRIHGTIEPQTIGTSVLQAASAWSIRMSSTSTIASRSGTQVEVLPAKIV